ncbi:hypothetical protein [Chryseobacterium sp.]|uniref:hypothetical protein n=1 Tax=Chryseobacterium sp. TaxID=1871047 RepID=UPI00289CE974|nr:hypothetical protein [Chryseobacterium sp.]
MKNNSTHIYIAALFLTLSVSAQAQDGRVGINTTAPAATLDVVASPSNATRIDGLIAPRLKGIELKSKDGLYTANQTGTIVYVTESLDGNASTTDTADDTTTKTAKVTETGYFYFDGTLWQPLAIEPWKKIGTTTKATSNTDNIYQLGRINVGNDATTVSQDFTSYNDSSFNSVKILQNPTNNVNSGYFDFKGITGTVLPTFENYGLYTRQIDRSNGGFINMGVRNNLEISGLKSNSNTRYAGTYNAITFTPDPGSKFGNLFNGEDYMKFAASNFEGAEIRGSSTINDITIGGTSKISQITAGLYNTSLKASSGGTSSLNVPIINGISNEIAIQINLGLQTSQIAGIVTKFSQYPGNSGSTGNAVKFLYGALIDNSNTSTLSLAENAYGLYIKPFSSLLTTDKKFNFYSEGISSKNFFEGRVGIGQETPAAPLHIVKQASDITPVIVEGLPVYDDNTAASALPSGALYRTSTGVLMVKY